MLNNILNGLKWLVFGFISIRLWLSGADSEKVKNYEKQNDAREVSRKLHDRILSSDDAKRLREKYRK